jgi:GTP cyclohydrolase FolE2
MKDVQKEKPENPLYIQKVGVKGISYPIVVSDKLKGTQVPWHPSICMLICPGCSREPT